MLLPRGRAGFIDPAHIDQVLEIVVAISLEVFNRVVCAKAEYCEVEELS